MRIPKEWTAAEDALIRETRLASPDNYAPQLERALGISRYRIVARARVLFGMVKKNTRGNMSRRLDAPTTAKGGMIDCLGPCGQPFKSVDKVRNRICPCCKSGSLAGMPAGW